MLNGGDEVYVNCMVIDQVGDLDISYINIEGIIVIISFEFRGCILGFQSSKYIFFIEISFSVYLLSENDEGIVYIEVQRFFMLLLSLCVFNLNFFFGWYGFEK